MKSEEIRAEIAAIEAQIKSLKDQLGQKNNELAKAISNELGFSPGDKVKVLRQRGLFKDKGVQVVGVGVFSGMMIKYGEARPIVHKIKKDGGVSKQEIGIYYGDVIEKV